MFKSILSTQEQRQWLIDNHVHVYNRTFEFNGKSYVINKTGVYYYVVDSEGNVYERSIRKTTAIYHACLIESNH